MTSAENILTLNNVTVGYGRHVVLSGVNLAFTRGTLYGLLGTNGSGKSTLLKTIAGIVPPLAGKAEFNLDGASGSSRGAVLGYVPQRETLDSAFLLSAFEVALMGVCGRVGPGRMIPAAEREHVRRCLAQTECESFAHSPFSRLSGGQRQRVLIARALASRPEFLLLDEPTAGIDAAATQAIMELLRKIKAQQRITIVLVNHDLALMRRYVEQVVWVRNGTVLSGPVGEMLSREKIEELMELNFS